MKTINVNFNNYYMKEYQKIQIYLHHTVSPNRRTINRNGITSDVNWWKSQNNYVNTPYIIDSDGLIYQLYQDKYWAFHLGTKDQHLNRISIGIELDNLGPLVWTKKGYTSFAYPNRYFVSDDNVIDYETKGYRGHRFYEQYSKEQIESLRLLLLHLTQKYNIPTTYNEDIWDITQKAFNHEPGIYSHTSVRKDKSDLHPQKELITMLKELNITSINMVESKVQIQIPKYPLVFTQLQKQNINKINFLSQLGWNKNIIK